MAGVVMNSVIASAAKQSRAVYASPGLLRCARNDGDGRSNPAQRRFGRRDTSRRSDVEPLAHVRHAIEPPRADRAIPHYIGRKRSLGRPLQTAPRDDLDADVDEKTGRAQCREDV